MGIREKAIGLKIAEVLGLRHGGDGLYHTERGRKTPEGLYAVVLDIMGVCLQCGKQKKIVEHGWCLYCVKQCEDACDRKIECDECGHLFSRNDIARAKDGNICRKCIERKDKEHDHVINRQ